MRRPGKIAVADVREGGVRDQVVPVNFIRADGIHIGNQQMIRGKGNLWQPRWAVDAVAHRLDKKGLIGAVAKMR